MSFFALFLFIVAGYVIQQYLLNNSLDNVSYKIKPDKRCVECDEQFTLNSSITNNKRLPLFYLRVAERIPKKMVIRQEGVTRHDISSAIVSDTSSVEHSMFVMPYQKVSSKLNVSIPERGRYLLRGAELSAGDLLGINDSVTRIDTSEEIVVYPKKADIRKAEYAFGGYLGDVYVRRFIMPDPIEVAGFHEYTGNEPQRDISWIQSLKKNQMMVKQYDYTAQQLASVILDVDECKDMEAEKAYEITRSVCEYLENHRIRYSFYTNAQMATINNIWSYIPDGIGSVHLNTVLEGLGRGEHNAVYSLDRLLQNVVTGRDETRCYVLVTADRNKKIDTIRKYERLLGQRVFVMDVKDVMMS